ncbi:hypothetical protein [Dialister invisus]
MEFLDYLKANKKYILGLIALWMIIIVFHMFFIRQLLPPQQGWWQYYAWQIDEGKLLYKDLYCFLPPYYIWLNAFLYPLFGFQMMDYFSLGIFLSCVTVTILYVFLNKYISVFWSFVNCLAGAILQYSYLMYIPFDYNQVIGSLVVVNGFLVAKWVKSGNNILLFLGGLCIGCFAMMKQTGAIYFVGIIFLLGIIGFKVLEKGIKPIMIYGIGFISAIVPGIMYLIFTETFNEFLFCILNVSSTKGPLLNVLYRTYRAGISFTEMLISLMIFLYIIKPFINLPDSVKRVIGTRIFSDSYVYILFLLILHKLSRFSGAEIVFIWNTLYWLIWLLYRHTDVLLRVSQKIKFYIYSRFFLKYKLFIIIMLILVTMLVTEYFGFSLRQFYYEQFNLFAKKRIITDVCFWISFIYCCYEFYYIVRTNRVKTDLSIFIFTALISGVIGVGLLSSVVEELYIMPLCCIVFMEIVKSAKKYNTIMPKIGLMVITTFILTVSITQKQIVSYSWHVWHSIGGNIPNINYTSSLIPGLTGFRLDEDTEQAYSRVIELINKYTDPGDAVFNFPHIPLFNCLTKRNNGTNVVALYFDVCPDFIASDTAEILKAKPPKMIIWNEFGDTNWDFHEKYFRGGHRSGQRDIIDWYNQVVHKDYNKVYEYKQLRVWVRP